MKYADFYKKIKTNLLESYEDDVKSHAAQINKYSDANRSEGKPYNKESAIKDIHNYAHSTGTVHYRLPSTKNAFVKDVLKHIKLHKTGMKPKTTGPSHQELAHKFESEAGNSFPDADPHDATHEWYVRKGGKSHKFSDELDKAVKKHLGSKSSHHYLRDMYDSVAKDASYDPKHPFHHLSKGPNPWK